MDVIANFFSSIRVIMKTINYVFITIAIITSIVFGIYYIKTKENAYKYFESEINHIAEIREYNIINTLTETIATMNVFGEHLLIEIENINKPIDISLYGHPKTRDRKNYYIEVNRYIKDLIDKINNKFDSIDSIVVASAQSGNVLARSNSNNDLTNIMSIMSHDEWIELLHRKIIIGKPYFTQASGTWVTPISLLVQHNNKSIIIVARICLNKEERIIFKKNENNNKDSEIYYLRSDHYIQYTSVTNRPLNQLYNQQYGLSIDSYDKNKLILLDNDISHKKAYAIIRFNKKFGLYTIITLPYHVISSIHWKQYSFIILFYVGILMTIIISWLAMMVLVKSNHNRLTKEANFDSLTGLPNRTYLNKEIKDRLKYAKKSNTIIVLFFIDLDDFKRVNDTYNHMIGDQLLVGVAKRFKDILREDDFIARLGGDEFVIIISDYQKEKRSEVDIDKIAKQIQASTVKTINVTDDISVYSNSSIGISIFPDSAKTKSELLRSADVAMYKAKKLGKNQYTIYNDSIEKETKYDFELGHELRKAIIDRECKDFYMLYQPQYRMKTNKMVGFEALVRWNNEKFPNVSPGQFIPIIEDMHLIDKLGDYIIEVSLKEWGENRKSFQLNDSPLTMSINMSPLQFSKGSDYTLIQEKLNHYNIPANELQIEVTETVLINESVEAMAVEGLVSHGINVAIDDFGIGYSSLKKLSTMPFSTIKIDKIFVDSIGNDVAGESLIHIIIMLGNKLGVDIVAEGVENDEQAEFLVQHCEDIIIQGYINSPAVNMATIHDLNRSS